MYLDLLTSKGRSIICYDDNAVDKFTVAQIIGGIATSISLKSKTRVICDFEIEELPTYKEKYQPGTYSVASALPNMHHLGDAHIQVLVFSILNAFSKY